MGLDRIRYSHPNPDNIGKKFVGDLGGAREGKVFTQEFTGSLGPSMRAVVPVFDGDEVVALVSVGITVEAIDRQLRGDLLLIAHLRAGRARRRPAGRLAGEPAAAAPDARAWASSRSPGCTSTTQRCCTPCARDCCCSTRTASVQLVNDEARRLLDLPDDVVGRRLDSLGLAPGLVAAAQGRTAAPDDIYLAGERALVVSSAPASWGGREVGAVVTLRDHTELRSVTGELDVVRGLTESLRAQTHEAANRLHTVVSLIEMGRPEQAIEFATEELEVGQRLTDRVVDAVGDPIVAALLLGKSAEAAERGIELDIDGELAEGDLPARDLVTVLGNLLDNAFDAVAGRDERRVLVRLTTDAGTTTVAVGDSGAGLDRGRRRPGARTRLEHQGHRGDRPRSRAGPGQPGRSAPRR